MWMLAEGYALPAVVRRTGYNQALLRTRFGTFRRERGLQIAV